MHTNQYFYFRLQNTGSCVDERGAIVSTHCTEAYPTTEEEPETRELTSIPQTTAWPVISYM